MQVVISFCSGKHCSAEMKNGTLFAIILIRYCASTSNNMMFVSELI
jgi:hypothetical protein